MNAYRWSKPLTLPMNIVIKMNGRATFMASTTLPVLPHMMPNAAKRKPERPIVGSETYIGRQLARKATSNASTTGMRF